MEKCMEDCKDIYTVVMTFLSLLEMVHEGELVFTVKKEEVIFARGVKYE